MKRYNIKYYHTCSNGQKCLEPAEDGEFYRRADVEKELKRLTDLLETEQESTPDFSEWHPYER